MSEVCEHIGVTVDHYMNALSVSKREKYFIATGEMCVNAYNPTVLKAWRANMDLQCLVDAYACVMYVASYMTKDEKGMGELLKQACKEHQDTDVKKTTEKSVHKKRHIGYCQCHSENLVELSCL